ncbi:MAG: alpha/beta hydrolase family protein [Nitrososphaerales archaeon]
MPNRLIETIKVVNIGLDAIRFRLQSVAGSLFQGEKRDKIAILLPGVPGSLYSDRSEIVARLVRDGFVVIAPEYIGTFASDGKFTFENAVDTILYMIDSIAKGKKFYDVWQGKYFAVSVRPVKNKVLLLGGSFGGSVALVAGSKSKQVNHIVGISTQGTYRESQESNREMLRIMAEGFPHVYRTDIIARRRFERGSVDLNPIEYSNELAKKNVLLIHGMKDNVVRYRESLKLHERLTKESLGGSKRIILLENKSHSGGSLAGEKEIYQKIKRWLRETGMK